MMRHLASLVLAVGLTAALSDPFCLHALDKEDHKCIEACAATNFSQVGETIAGICSSEYNTLDKEFLTLQCPDGVTNLRYCPDTAMNVTMRIKGEEETTHMLQGDDAPPSPISPRRKEVWDQKATEAAGIIWRGNSTDVSSHELLSVPEQGMPDAFTWCDKDGVNYCTMSRNQHIPQYCGSCWAHGSVSALGDRVKIARKGKGIDINLSVQHILNCGNVGSCHGGSVDGPYQWLHRMSRKNEGISYETSNPYMACSSESKEGFCPHADWTCKADNVARTCSTFPSNGGFCGPIKTYPNVTISDFGSISGFDSMQKEIYNRGPISCGIDAAPILNYTSGIATDDGESVDHVVSVVGWGSDGGQTYWIVRNSWGEYWGEMGYIRVAKGALQLEDQCAWAVVESYTAQEMNNQVHCFEGGQNCGSTGSE